MTRKQATKVPGLLPEWLSKIRHYFVDEYQDFEDLPSGWVCPVCGAPHDEFEEYD